MEVANSLRELESASLVEDIASEVEKTIPRVICKLTDNVIELESEDPEVHESVKETLSDVPSEDDKLSNKAHECTLQWKTVTAVQPQIAVEFENVTAVTEVHFAKLLTDFAIELERVPVRRVTELLVQDELLNVIAEDLAVEVITSSFTELESFTCLKTLHLRQRKYFQGSPAN